MSASAINQQQQNHGSQFNIVDQVIAAQTISALQTAFSGNGGFSLASIMSLLFVIFMDAIKKLIIKAVEQMLQHIEANKVNMFKSFLNYLDITRYFTKPKRNIKLLKYDVKDVIEKGNPVTKSCLAFDPTLNFWNALYHQYKAGESGINIDINHNFSMVQKDNTAYVSTELWNNVVINLPRMTAHLSEQLKVTFTIENDLKTITNVKWSTANMVITDDTVLETLIDFVPFPNFRTAFKSKFDTFIEKVSRAKGGPEKLDVGDGMYSPVTYRKVAAPEDAMLACDIMDVLCDTFDGLVTNNYIHYRCTSELYWLLSLTSVAQLKTSNGASTTFNTAWKKSKNRHFLGVSLNGEMSSFRIDASVYACLKDMPDVQLVADWLTCQLVGLEPCRENLGVGVKLFSETLTPVEMQSDWLNFAKSIQQSSALHTLSKKATYSIFTLRVEETETTMFRDNPHFDQWNERREDLKNMMKDPNCCKDMCAELAKNLASIDNNPQTKQIAYQKVSRSVIKEHINDTKKEFSTLFLRKQDKATLENCMFQFKEKKELLEELGIPNKLGIMLYGLPGTGKTSTINAIATYLQKNLYYINMNSVKTNTDLKLLFDFVNKNCIDGGIIIMEDIDAMTKVVHTRQPKEGDNASSEQRSLSNAEVLDTKDSELTLEFFLNILQGSLTADGSIFICTTNHIEKLDPAFCRDGRFDVKIEMKPADRHQFQEMYMKYFKERIPEDLMLKIVEYKFVPATVLARFARYIHQKESPEEILSPFLEQ